MPTKFETAFAVGMNALLDMFGIEVDYSLDGGDSELIVADWKPDQMLHSYMPNDEQDVGVGVLSVSPATIPEPTLRDVVDIEGRRYAVVSIQRGQGAHDLQLESRVHLKTKRNARTMER